MKKILSFVLAIFFSMTISNSVNAEGWYWLSSDSKYTKEFDPNSVVITQKKNVNGKDIPTQIMVWTKTVYSYQGAAETIKTYNIGHLIPNPATLSHSLAQILINPQDRTIQYQQEIFYDKSSKPLYTRNTGRIKEINSQEFDEDFYASAVDEVFRMGEMARRKAKDRWITLWAAPVANETVTVTADTTTFRVRGNNLIFWEWEEHKNLKDQVTEIRFQKKRINVDTGAEQLVTGQVWKPKTGWQNLNDPYEGRFHNIEKTSPAIKGIERLKAYAKGYSTWVHRYSIEPNVQKNAAASTMPPAKDVAKPNSTATPAPVVPPKPGETTKKPVLSSKQGENNANKNTK